MDVLNEKIKPYLYRKLHLSIFISASLCSFSIFATTFQLGDLAPKGAPDGQLNAADYLILQKIVLGNTSPNDNELVLGDVAPLGLPNGVLNTGDLIVHQRALLGLLDLGVIEIGLNPVEEIDMALLSVNTVSPGILVVSGMQSSVGANATVTISNRSNNEVTIVVANNAGVFSVNINGNTGDVLDVTVTDELGNSSDGIAYVVGAIQIVTPVNNSLINDNEVNVYGAFTGERNAGIYLNGRLACISNNSFYVNNVPLQVGVNTLTATIKLLDGTVSSSHINVGGDVSNSFHIDTINNGCITDNLVPVSFNPTPDFWLSRGDWDGDGALDYNTGNTKNFTVDYESDSIVDVVTAAFYVPGLVENNYNTAGVYEAVFVLTDKQDATYVQKQYVVVQDESELNSLFESIWLGMNTALVAGDRDLALTYLNANTHHLYGPLFDALIPHMNEIQEDYSAIKPISFGVSVTDYAILKVVDGEVRTHIINFKRDSNGLWKINSL